MNAHDRPTTGLLQPHGIAGGGQMGERIRRFDWSQTPLGPSEQWPASLLTVVRVLINSRYPMFVWWGPELINIYNDAYIPVLGARHPQALGQPAQHIWAEIWDAVGPQADEVFASKQATWNDSMLLVMERHNYREETYFTFSYSPVLEADGSVGGVFCACTEETERVLGERRLQTLRDLAADSAHTPEEACRHVAQALGGNPHDIPFSLVYLVDGIGKRACLQGASGIVPGTPASPAEIILAAAEHAWPVASLQPGDALHLVPDLAVRFGALPGGPWPEPARQAVILPIARPGQDQLAGFVIAGISPRRTFDDSYAGFYSLVAGQVATGIANARAYAEERQRAEALAELDRAKTTFFANVSHEFRTPLTLLLGPLEALLHDAALSEGDRERLDLARNNALRLLKLVNTLLDISRVEQGRQQAHYEPTDLDTFTAELASGFRSVIESAGLDFHVDTPPFMQPVVVDRSMWEKIVLNLLSNAFKFTLQGSIAVRMYSDGDDAVLEVCDTGIGIAPQEIPHLFERFHRIVGARSRTPEGTGIGLSLVRDLVKLHDGTIEVQSVPDEGSVFRVRIPAAGPNIPSEQHERRLPPAGDPIEPRAYINEVARWLTEPEHVPADVLPAPDLHHSGTTPTKRVLLVDDNADMRAYLRRLLERFYLVETVADGTAALAAAQARPPDLILTDVMMPGLDGFELVRALRAGEPTRNIPIIMLSARAGEESRVDGIEAGADDYIVKPFSARELLARIAGRIELAEVRHETLQMVQRSETRLRANEALLQRAFHAARIVVWEWNPARQQMSSTDTLQDVFGLDSLPSLEALFERVHPADRDHYRATVQHVAEHSGTYHLEYRWQRPDNSMLWLEEWGFAGPPRAATPANPAATPHLIAIALDITARRQAQDALRSSELRFRTLADSAPFMVWLTERDGTCSYLSQSWYEFTGQTSATGLGMGWLDAVHPDEQRSLLADIETANLRRQSLRAEYRVLHQSGQYRWVIDVSMPRLSESGEFLGMIGSVLDISERKHMEEALREKEREQQILYAQEQAARQEAETASRLKDEFLATVSHELRTPLTTILGYAQLLQSRRRDDAYTERVAGMIVRSAKAQSQIVEDLLDVSRIVSGTLRLTLAEIDLREVINNALDIVRPAMEAKEIRLRTDLDLAARTIVGDAGRLQQVIWNLLSNAIKFTPPGGAIDVRLQPSNQAAEIVVRDTGEGINPAFLPYIFDRFRQGESDSTRTRGGLGLGLAIVRHLVEMHGGTVMVDSRGIGQGATFTVRIPRGTWPPGGGTELHSPAQSAECPPELQGLRVLIVDDQPDILELVHEILSSCGAEVRVCNRADNALALLTTWRPDVLVSDIAMPGHDGYWLIDQVRALSAEQGGETAAVALTAYVRVEERAHVLAAGFHMYVPKPIDQDELRSVVASLAHISW